MIRWIVAAAYLLSILALTQNIDASEPLSTISSLLEQTCVDCHSKETSEGGLDLTALSFELNNRAVRERWVRIHDRVEKGEMPPQADDFRMQDLIHALVQSRIFLGSASGELFFIDRKIDDRKIKDRRITVEE